jgi:hypothetical protein
MNRIAPALLFALMTACPMVGAANAAVADEIAQASAAAPTTPPDAPAAAPTPWALSHPASATGPAQDIWAGDRTHAAPWQPGVLRDAGAGSPDLVLPASDQPAAAWAEENELEWRDPQYKLGNRRFEGLRPGVVTFSVPLEADSPE